MASNLMTAEQLLRFERRWTRVFVASASALLAVAILRLTILVTPFEAMACYGMGAAAIALCLYAAKKLRDSERIDSTRANRDELLESDASRVFDGDD